MYLSYMYIAILYMKPCTALFEACFLRIQKVLNCSSNGEFAEKYYLEKICRYISQTRIHTRARAYIYICEYIYIFLSLFFFNFFFFFLLLLLLLLCMLSAMLQSEIMSLCVVLLCITK